ncbi:MAG TPA: polymer-forming cytoskeletal protein [Alphaproteobacteria bacterium]|nr:polymer-forming cytoskeletal protein [Alphaproteobacteria bacterium]
MFSKASKIATATMSNEPKASLRPGIPSIISADMKIVGSLESAGDLQIDGTIEGDVTSRTLTVSDTASVRGSISADAVKVSGTVKGGISAKSVTLTRSAKVKGDIVHQTLSIETGANFEGQCKRRSVDGLEPRRLPLISDAGKNCRSEIAVELGIGVG